MRRRFVAAALVALLGLIGAACGDDDNDGSPSDTTFLEPGDQPGSGADGSVPDGDTPGNHPGTQQSDSGQ